MKRVLDFTISVVGLALLSPLILIVIILIWLQDFKNPFYIAERVGLNNKSFKIFKLRSMVVNADASGVDSTGENDIRITQIGKFIRKFKLDEISQLINVFLGNMSLVGPRPNVRREVEMYTEAEKVLLSIKPGITDFSSIVFSDEGSILKDFDDPDLAYNQLIRPGKGELGVFYVHNRTFFTDLRLIFITIIAIFSRNTALKHVSNLLKNLEASDSLINLASRSSPLIPRPPIGSDHVITKRG